MSLNSLTAARDQLKRERNGVGNIVVVVGPPCSGKSGYVAGHRAPTDVVIDFDAIAVALGSADDHDHSPVHLGVAHAAREAAIDRARRTPGAHTVWVILTSVSQLEQFGLTGVKCHQMDTPLDECERRARATNRSGRVIDLIRSWT